MNENVTPALAEIGKGRKIRCQEAGMLRIENVGRGQRSFFPELDLSNSQRGS